MAITTAPRASTTVTEALNSEAWPAACASSTATGVEALLSVFVSLHLWSSLQIDCTRWLRYRMMTPCVCVSVAMEIKYDVKTVAALLDQFYNKRRLLILSAPNITDPDYQLQNIMIQVRRLHFTCSFFSWFQINRKMLKNLCALPRNQTVGWTCDA